MCFYARAHTFNNFYFISFKLVRQAVNEATEILVMLGYS
jgi:hypothetical protein